MIKFLLLASCSASTTNARLGFGLHNQEVAFENLLTFGILSNVSGFTSIIAVACSKTSFAITLLRLADGWVKWFIIGLLFLLNTTHYLSALFFWVSCNPPAKTYNVLLPGDCWPTSVTVNYSLFVGGMANSALSSCDTTTDAAQHQHAPHSATLPLLSYHGESCSASTCTTERRSAWPLP